MPKRTCKFTKDLEKEFPMFVKSKVEGEVECKTCNNALISMRNKGRFALVQHIDTEKHQKNIRGAKKTVTLDNTFKLTNSEEGNRIAAVEATLAYHTVCHHFSYNSTDCTHELLSKLFADSKIATKVHCGRTKTQAIVDNVLAPYSLESVHDTLNDIKFVGVSTDGSNFGNKKLFPILIQFFDKDKGIQHKLTDLVSLKNEKSETVNDSIMKSINEFQLNQKCIAFGADNTNTNFGSVNRNSGENIYTKLQNALGRTIAGIGCGDHILNNAFHHALDLFGVNIDPIIFKIHQHFSYYTVRVESLQEFCNDADVNYQNLLSSSKTRFLSIFPGVERVLKLYEPLKEYFLSLEAAPVLLSKFFEDPLSEAILFFIHSLASVFHCSAAKMEKENGSLLETMSILDSVKNTLSGRINGNFIPYAVRNIFTKNDDMVCGSLKVQLLKIYSDALAYLNMWTKQFEEFKIFTWMNFEKDPEFDCIQICIDYLRRKGVVLSEEKCFDQLFKLKQFISDVKDKKDFKDKLAHEKWVTFFKNCSSSEQYSEFLIICEYFFAIPPHNANCERIFSMMGYQWSDVRNRLLPESIKQIMLLKFNFKELDCLDFFKMILEKKDILNQVKTKEKYSYERRNKEVDVTVNDL